MKHVWVYDLEQFPNCHTATFVSRTTTESRQFVIHSSRNDIEAYLMFLERDVGGLIGFNSVNYDYPLLHFLVAVATANRSNMQMLEADMFNRLLYEESQRIINEDYSAIHYKDVKIPQLDLFKIHHFDNKAKITSLKAVEIAINFPNVQDMPFEHDHWIKNDEVEDVLSYNMNDTQATKKFYDLSRDMVELRKTLSKKYNIYLTNYNDPKIGEEIFGREIARRKGWNYWSLKDMRTYRRSIDLRECVLDSIEFNSKEFNEILTFFNNTVIVTTYKAFEKSVIYKGFKYDYGTGGLHGCIESGVYESDQDYIIYDIDVQGYYPSLAISNGFYPQHLGPVFVDVYEGIVEMKNEAARTGDKATRSGMKLAGNGVYGKSNDQYSLFYDPKYTMQVTINGQLQLSMLAESLVDNIFDMEVLQVNTDGITIKVKKTSMLTVKTVCEQWEEDTGLVLEYAEYSKMVIRDVNNYLAYTVDGQAKPKGAFEIIPMQNGAVAYNKNWSMRVVPKAIHEYYLKGVKPEKFIRNHNNIYDFGIGFRSRGDWDIYYTYIDNNQKKKEKQQKTIRYYMSKLGGMLTKENRKDGRVISLEAGRGAIMFNQYVERKMEDYKIDYGYYIAETNKIINAVDDGQLKMF